VWLSVGVVTDDGQVLLNFKIQNSQKSKIKTKRLERKSRHIQIFDADALRQEYNINEA